MNEKYEVVIGLEVHAALDTKTKAFCSCSTEYGNDVNTNVCEICLGMPGALPKLNENVVDYAIRAGLATNCDIREYSKQDRKNYFYPDLPKAYQISQYDLPLCEDGFVDISGKKIGITRIHIEEDAGKLTHDYNGSKIDFNRGGIPLIEIVSEPDLRSPEEAKEYLEKLRNILLYIGVSDCKMNQGSLRCDVNLSIREKGSKEFGTRTEIKNMNSFNNAVKAMEKEAERQIEIIENGGTITQDTLRWDDLTGEITIMRSKEDAKDYRYFPEPDLVGIEVDEERINKVKKSIPKLPEERKENYIKVVGLSEYDSELIVSYKYVSDYFDEGLNYTDDAKQLVNFITREVFNLMSEDDKEDGKFPVDVKRLAELINLINKKVISNNIGKKVFDEMIDSDKTPNVIVDEKGLKQISDDSKLLEIINKVLDDNKQSVEDYLGGKDRAIKALMGQVMKVTRGKANPAKVNKLLKEKLEKMK